MDSFYPSENSHDRDKIRVTRDEKTGTVLESMRKVRLGNLDIYSPKRQADWRISVNLEIPGTCFNALCPKFLKKNLGHSVSHPLGSSTFTRRKDRMSYSHEEFNIDLTQVQSSRPMNAPVCRLFPLVYLYIHVPFNNPCIDSPKSSTN